MATVIDNNKRLISLGTLLGVIEHFKLPIETIENFIVEIEDSAFTDLFFGDFTRKISKTTEDTNVQTFKNANVIAVMGGISYNSFARRHVEGVIPNTGTGTMSVDMSASWIKKFGITKDDFLYGTPRFITSTPAAKKLRYANSKSLTQKGEFENHRIKYGSRYLYSLESIRYFQEHRTLDKSSMLMIV